MASTSEFPFVIGEKADLEQARVHNKASRVRQLSLLPPDDMRDFCKCCNLPLTAPKFSLGCPVKDLHELGAGFPLYFYFVKNAALMSFVCVAVACIACAVNNIMQNNNEGWEYGDNKWYIQPSIGAFANDFSKVPFWQGTLHSIVVFLFIIDLLAFRHFLNKRGEEFDFDTIRPSHFTVWIKNLNKDFDPEELTQFMKHHGRGYQQESEIYDLNVVYDIGNYVAASRKEAQLKAKQLYVQEYRNYTGDEPRSCCCCREIDSEAVENEIRKIEKDLQEQEKAFQEGIKNLQIGQVLLTFKKQTDARAVAMNWSRSGLSIFFQWLCRCCFKGPVHFNNSYFVARLAPEPSDIMWENLNVSWIFRLYRRIITWLVMILVFVGSFFLCIFIKDIQKKWFNDNAQASDAEYYRFKLFSFLLSLSIVFINQCLGLLAKELTEQEKHQTSTHYSLAMSYKLCIFQVLNTTVLLIVINAVSLSGWETNFTWWTPNGLVNDVLNLMYTECTIGPLTCIFSPVQILKRFKRFRLERRAKAGLITVTQNEANEIFENVPFDIAQRYSNIIRILFLTFVFAPIIPMATAFGFLALVINYWVDKIILLRRNSRPRLLGMELSDNIMMWLPILVLSYAASNFVICYYEGQKNMMAPLCTLGLAGFFWIIPFKWCLRRVPIEDNIELRERILPSYFDDYEKNAPYFIEDYARANPVTAQAGWAKWLNLVGKELGHARRDTWARHSRMPQQTGERLYEYAVRSSAISPSNRPLKGQRYSHVRWMNPPEAAKTGKVRNPFLEEIREEEGNRLLD